MKKIFSLTILVLLLQFNKAYSDGHQTPFGTEDEAKAMLERAINIVNFDKKYALNLFTNLSGGFQLNDLYVFCGTLDGTIVAHPSTVGNNMFDFYDSNGKNLGAVIIRSANENQIDKVEYMLGRPTAEDSDTELAKTAFVTKIDDLVCGVGYYSK